MEESKREAKGTPQGGVISPVLANLFMHYAFDKWMERTHPDKPFARYADDGGYTVELWRKPGFFLKSLKTRMEECKPSFIQRRPIVYCKKTIRGRIYIQIQSFDF